MYLVNLKDLTVLSLHCNFVQGKCTIKKCCCTSENGRGRRAGATHLLSKNTKISEDYEISNVIDIDYIGIQQTKSKSKNRDSERISGQQMK